MHIDIEYLLFLQEMRMATGGFFNEIFNAISKIAVDIMPILPYLIFWAVDKSWGYRFMGTLWSGEVVNGVMKLTACAYRPWIRDSRIEPAGDSKVAATGYSFPSGHTLNATSMYGTTAVWQRKKRKGLFILCIVMILLTGFSRNFLGVHTPQDVLVALIEASFVMFVAGLLQNRLKDDPKLCDILTVVGLTVVVAALIYIQIKPYPMDYVDGKLLVDPQKMMNDSFKALGGLTGFLAGSHIERHFVKYEIPKNSKNLPLLAGVGVGIMYSWITFVSPATLQAWFGAHWGTFISYTLMLIFAIALYPLFIRKNK